MSNVRSITPNDPANFTPEFGNYKTLQPFRYWCQKVLPLVYDDSLSYYELLCKVVDYLNKTMEDVETLHGDVTNLHTAYEKLQGYVNDYFSTLDVQEEINKKLDNMANSGELYEIIRRYTDPIVNEQNDKINEQNDKINVLKSRMDTFTSLPEGSTSNDAELQDIRVGYNGTIYNTAGDAVRMQVSELNSGLVNLDCAVFNVKTSSDLTWVIGAVNKADGRPVTMSTRIRTVRFIANGGSVKPRNGYMIGIAVYSSDDWDGFEKYVDFSTNEYKFELGKYYVIVIKADPEVSFTDTDITNALNMLTVRYWNGDNKIESNTKNIEATYASIQSIKDVGLSSKINFSVGGLDGSNGSITDNAERLHSDIIFVRKGSTIKLKPNKKLKFAVYKYGDLLGNEFISSTVLSLDDYIFTEGCYIRILVETGDTTQLKDIDFDLFSFDLSELNNRVKYTELTKWVDKGFISISEVNAYTKFVVESTKEWSFMVLPVHSGDKFIVYGYGGNNARLYAFTDRFGKVLKRTEKINMIQKLIITAPSDGYAIFNVLRSDEHKVIKFNTNTKIENDKRNLIIPPYMPDMFKAITSVPNNKTTVMSYEEIMGAWENLRQKYPDYITRTLLGKDTSGTLDMYRYDFKPEIVLLSGSVQSGMNKIYTKDDYPIVIMDACIHGAERPCAKALLNLMELIADAKDYSILGWMRNNIHFVIVPIANPWGYKNNSRTNVNHVDINRNFEPLWERGSSDSADDRFRGVSPLSEKESQHINTVLSECSEKAVCYYSFHTHGLFTGYNAMTNFSSPALFMLNEMQNIGMSVTKMITASGWTNHNLPQDSGYIGQMEMAYSAMASYQGALHGIPSACPEVMYRYYDGGTSEIYNTDVDCMNTEYILYAVANACKKFLYDN
mgnify:CR=1 FL=1|jgi:hypothetical protein